MNFNMRDLDPTQILARKKTEVEKEKLSVKRLVWEKMNDEQITVVKICQIVGWVLAVLVIMVTTCNMVGTFNGNKNNKPIEALSERVTNLEKANTGIISTLNQLKSNDVTVTGILETQTSMLKKLTESKLDTIPRTTKEIVDSLKLQQIKDAAKKKLQEMKK